MNIYIKGMGQGTGDETLLFLMEDGTLEYMPVRHAICNDTIKSYGKLEKLLNIVDISIASIHYNEGGGYVSPIAITNDGNFYELSPMLNATGYYSWN